MKREPDLPPTYAWVGRITIGVSVCLCQSAARSNLVVPIVLAISLDGIPESFGHGGKLAGVFTVLGFAVSVAIIVMEYGPLG